MTEDRSDFGFSSVTRNAALEPDAATPDAPSPDTPSPARTGRAETENHAVSAANARELQRLTILTQILRGWIWETDVEHRFTYLSDSVARYAGRPPEWHYGKTRQELGNLNLDEAQRQIYMRQIDAREKLAPFDFVRYQNGQQMGMRTIGLPQFDADGHFTGYCGVAFEVTGEIQNGHVNRRGEPRRKVARTATILEQAAPTPVPCVVLDISANGARLDVEASATVPPHFKLLIDVDASERQCVVVWRKENSVGVRFCD